MGKQETNKDKMNTRSSFTMDPKNSNEIVLDYKSDA